MSSECSRLINVIFPKWRELDSTSEILKILGRELIVMIESQSAVKKWFQTMVIIHIEIQKDIIKVLSRLQNPVTIPS